MNKTPIIKTKKYMKQWLTIRESAQQFGITTSSLYEWLDRHPEIKMSYCQIRESERKKPIMFISREGLVVIATMKDKFRGNKTSQGNPDNQGMVKKKIAEYAIQNSKTTLISPETVLLQTAQILSRLEQRIEKLEGKSPYTDKKPRELPLSAIPKTPNALRSLLSMRINTYAKETGAEYRDLWNLLYISFSKETGVNLKERAVERGIEPLDIAERDGYLQKLYKLASQLYRCGTSVSH